MVVSGSPNMASRQQQWEHIGPHSREIRATKTPIDCFLARMCRGLRVINATYTEDILFVITHAANIN